MTTDTDPAAPQPPDNYVNVNYHLRSWLFPTDHKRVALHYLVAVTLMFLLGGLAASTIRLQLMTPSGWVVNAEVYNELVTLHSLVMVFFFLVPSIFAVIGGFIVPMMMGAANLAFPRLNLLGLYLYLLGAACTLAGMACGGVDAAWTESISNATLYSSQNVLLAAIGIFIAGLSAVLTSVNFIATIHTRRAPGLTWARLPLCCWSFYAASILFIVLFGTPLLILLLARIGLGGVFQPALLDPRLGGDPYLFHHLFWYYTHPMVYLLALPAIGVVSEIIECFVGKRIFGYGLVALCSLALALFGLLALTHHLFGPADPTRSAVIGSILRFLIAIPWALLVLSWTATLVRGSIWLASPMLYALGFVGLFTIGGLAGLILAAMGTSLQLRETHFSVAHLHYILGGGAIMAFLAAVHYWWPKITGRLYPESWARASACIVFVGVNLTFLPEFILGYRGMPERYDIYPPQFQVYHVMSTAGASILLAGFLLPLCYLIWSLWYGSPAGSNPWQSRGLEWQTPSPPPPGNFAQTPTVTAEA